MKIKFFLIFSFFFSFIFFAQVAQAAEPKLSIQDQSYTAAFVSQSIADPFTIEAGATKTVIFKFKNIGTTTWQETGKNYISAYTMEPKYRDSEFRSAGWISSKQTGKMKGTVKPGGVGELAIEFKAPLKTGSYIERFYLSSENHTWVKGGYFFVKINVVAPSKKVTQAPPSTPSKPVVTTGAYQAKFLGLSKPQIMAAPGERVSIIFMYQNTGTKPWTFFSFKGNEEAGLAGQSLSYADESWKSPTLVREGTIHVVKEGVLQKSFTLKAPLETGIYKAKFYLEVEGQKVDGSEAVIDITVTSNAPGHVEEAISLPPPPPVRTLLAEEPKIRVGLQKIEKDLTFVSSQDEYDIYNGEQLVDRLPLNAPATFSYKSGVYTCLCNGNTLTSNQYFRLVPVTNFHSVFELKNFSRTVSWQPGVNYSTYHGAFEFRFPKTGDLPYAINELYFEDYIAGIREVSNGTPMEYMKSQAVLERTYAYYIKESTDKHADRYFDVVASTGDQLYLGYESEKLMPRFVEAVRGTRGFMVVYDVDQNPSTAREIVITPYFGNSDGNTRSWQEVWGGKNDKPWLVSVPAIYDKRDRKSMYGHGVGMSQRDAMIKADEEKLDYNALIKYYYTGVEIEQIY